MQKLFLIAVLTISCCFAKGAMVGWLYEWDSSGMLTKVTNPQQGKISFGYDPLGRRVFKESKGVRTNWSWDDNVPLHEWQTTEREPLIDIITWVFEGDAFVPTARLTANSSQSIITDYLGTPTQMFDENGKKTWEADLDIYDRVRTFAGRSLNECPFRYQGQYEDSETGLYYNRFRYYDPSIGGYISQDPIGLASGEPNLYAYVYDPNSWIDVFGLYLRRPYISKDTQLSVEGNATIINGRFFDTVDGETAAKRIEITGGKRRPYSLAEGEYQLGHKKGSEYWRLKARAEADDLSQKQFNDLMNNPKLYQIEDPKANMSHKREEKGKSCKKT